MYFDKIAKELTKAAAERVENNNLMTSALEDARQDLGAIVEAMVIARANHDTTAYTEARQRRNDTESEIEMFTEILKDGTNRVITPEQKAEYSAQIAAEGKKLNARMIDECGKILDKLNAITDEYSRFFTEADEINSRLNTLCEDGENHYSARTIVSAVFYDWIRKASDILDHAARYHAANN